MIDLKNLTRDEMAEAMLALGAERYRGDQVFRWVHRRDAASPADMTDLGQALRETLARMATIGRLTVDEVQRSRDGTRKLRLLTADRHAIETVLIPVLAEGRPAGTEGWGEAREAPPSEGGREGPPDNDDDDAGAGPHKLTQCISSQVGCALDCSFCATARLGFGRQLTAGEIVDQVYRARALVAGLAEDDPTRRASDGRLTNLVYMGMGEPLHNVDEVARSIEILGDPQGANLSPRRITVSTAGLVPGIAKLGDRDLGVGLAVSLNATTDEVRDSIMPVNRKWNLAALLDAVRAFPLERRQRVTFEYVLLAGINDTPADAERLPRLLAGIPSKVNLIPWNPHPGAPYRRPSDANVEAFQRALKTGGLAVYLRRPRGDDIDAACGQLAARVASSSG